MGTNPKKSGNTLIAYSTSHKTLIAGTCGNNVLGRKVQQKVQPYKNTCGGHMESRTTVSGMKIEVFFNCSSLGIFVSEG